MTLLGHANPALVAALEAQARKLWHTSNLYQIPNQEALAERLVAATFADTVFVTNSGTEAIECAIKMARKHFDQGRAGAEPDHRLRGLVPRAELRRDLGGRVGEDDQGLRAGGAGVRPCPVGDLAAVEEAIGPETARRLVEPIQGEGGIRVMPPGSAGARALCDRHGMLLVLDEIQCGMGRTGKLFYHEWAGIAPDIMTMAKGIGGGFPLGACLATEKAADGMTAGTHGTTYGGNPLACAVGCAVMDIVTAPGLPRPGEPARRAVPARGSRGWSRRIRTVFESVRGVGLMLGLKCRAPNPDVVRAGYDAHVLVVAAATTWCGCCRR